MSKRIATNPADERSRLYIAECQSDSNPTQWYKVTIRRGQWECGCRGWTMHVPRRACKHITRLRTSLSDKHDTNLAGIRLLDDWRLFRSYTAQPLGNIARVPELHRVEPVVLAVLSVKSDTDEAPEADWEAMVAALRSYMPTAGRAR